MSTDSKVLAFPEKKVESSEANEPGSNSAPVVDIGVLRKEIIDAERRSVRRTILTDFIGVHLIIPGKGLHKCTLFDISEKGLAFDLEKNQGMIKTGENLAMRVYLNHKTYFGFTVVINNARFIESENIYRHGASFHSETLNQQALHHFVKFIENVSASLKTDSGDVIVSNIDSP